MNYLIISYSYENVDVSDRERISLDKEKSDLIIKEVLSDGVTKEMMIVSSCNRTEAIFFTPNLKSTSSSYISQLSKVIGVNRNFLADYKLEFTKEEAIKRFFTVISSLNSIVVGETQITGQYRTSFKYAIDNKYCGENISRLFHFAVKCASKIRSCTELGKLSLSVASIAVGMAKSNIDDFENKKVLVVGSGATGSLVMKYLKDSCISFDVTNRTKSKMIDVIEKIQINSCNIIDFSDLPLKLKEYDVIFSATSSPKAVIDSSASFINGKKQYFFDLAIPRDIDLKNSDDIIIYTIEDFKYISESNLKMKNQYLDRGMEIIEEMYIEFLNWIKTLEIEPLIKTIRLKAQEKIDYEVSRVIDKKFFNRNEEKNLKKMSNQVIDLLLHNFSKNLRGANKKDIPVDTLVESLNYLFDISDFQVKNRYSGNYSSEDTEN